MASSRRLLQCAFVLPLLLAPWLRAEEAPLYDVQLSSLTWVEVTVTLPQFPSKLYMLTAASGSDDGFASYVKNIALTCGSRTAALQRSGAMWKPAMTLPGPCTLRYEVDLGFTKAKWEVGNEQAGFTDGKGTFVVSKAVFIECDIPGVRRVKLHVPPNWVLVTPWLETGNGTFQFGQGEELEDLIAFGQLAAHETSEGTFHVKLVTFGELSRQQPLIDGTIERISSTYNKTFPDTQLSSYLVVLIPGIEVDGEAYNHGFASTVHAPLKQDERVVWADGIAHEMFHHWNGRLLRAAEEDGDLEWFTEGVTEYFANLALIRTKEISEDDFLHKVAANVGQYEYFLASGLFNDATILAAGKKKGRYRFGVYAGGWMMAFVMDQEIRERSGGKHSLVDLLRLLLASRNSGALTVPVILDAVQELAGPETRSLLNKAISTRESVHPENYLSSLGLDIAGQSYQDEYYIHKSESASADQIARRLAWCGF